VESIFLVEFILINLELLVFVLNSFNSLYLSVSPSIRKKIMEILR
jgi:hypothetical protein